MPRVLTLVGVVVLATACAPRVASTTRGLPAAVQLDVLRLTNVWVAGFVANGNDEVDVNLETVRLLRAELRARSSARIVDVDPLSIDSEQRLTEVSYWRRLGEEHGSPLIVTGSLRLLLAPAALEQRGRRTVHVANAGRVLQATVVLIDGRTGEMVARQELPTRVRYSRHRPASGLALYYELMEQALPDWLEAIAARTAGETRMLPKSSQELSLIALERERPSDELVRNSSGAPRW